MKLIAFTAVWILLSQQTVGDEITPAADAPQPLSPEASVQCKGLVQYGSRLVFHKIQYLFQVSVRLSLLRRRDNFALIHLLPSALRHVPGSARLKAPSV